MLISCIIMKSKLMNQEQDSVFSIRISSKTACMQTHHYKMKCLLSSPSPWLLWETHYLCNLKPKTHPSRVRLLNSHDISSLVFIKSSFQRLCLGQQHICHPTDSDGGILQCNLYNDGLVQDYSNSIANALELLQCCTKPSIRCPWLYFALVSSSVRASVPNQGRENVLTP